MKKDPGAPVDDESEIDSENSDEQPGDQILNHDTVQTSKNQSLHITVRRDEISSTCIREGQEELKSLGIQAYDQNLYEQQVFNQVDEAISHVNSDINSNSCDLVNLIQTGGDFPDPNCDNEGDGSLASDERILELTRRQRDRVVVKKEKTSTTTDFSALPRIPRLSNHRVKTEPHSSEDVTHGTDEERSSITLFWRPNAATVPPIEKHEPDNDILDKTDKLSCDEVDEDDDRMDEDIDYETDSDSNNQFEKKTSKKRHNISRIVDDGDVNYYRQRIKQYARERAQMRLNNIDESGVETKQIDDMFKIDDGFQIPISMWENLFEHQKTGVKWLWELHQLRVGGILGDEMGLGKTIQTIAFLTALRNSTVSSSHRGYDNLGPVVLVCPATVMFQWLLEFRKWWPEFRVAILHSTGAFSGDRGSLVKSVNKSNGILIVSYPGVIIYQDLLHALDWHYAILDEGHKIRNPDAQVTLACKRFRTPHRIILSGSPVQNNLKELWSIFDFIYPGKLGTLPVFIQQFSIPITQGGYANATDVQVQIAYKCSCILRDTIKPFLLRRTKAEVNSKLKLPDRSEQVLFCKLTDRQYQLYDAYLKSPTVRDIKAGLLHVFVGLTHLRKICNHPDLFDWSDLKHGGNKDDFDLNDKHYSDRSFGCYKRSGKMMVVDALLSIWKKQGDKVLLFTQSRQMLRIFERYLEWKKYQYLSMDGTTSIGLRQSTIDKFNNSEEIFVFLLTTRVGGVGINLVGANRIIIFDPDWNPSTDIQARERAWRIGQHRQVIIYRLLTAGTIEEKIYHRQVFKLYLTNRILKDAKQKRFFKTNDLHELFTLGDNEKNIETKALFDNDLQINAGDLERKRKKLKKLKKKKKLKRDKSKVDIDNIKLTDEQLDAIRERARKLSQMIASQYGKCPDGDTVNNNINSNCLESQKQDTSNNLESAKRIIIPNNINPEPSTSKISDSPKKRSKEKLDYLVRQDLYKPESDNRRKSKSSRQEQEDYILDTLFKSSNIFGALKHDKIETDSTADFKVIESEAERVARDAIRVLRESRRMCMGSLSGVPNWTGRNGQVATSSTSRSSVFHQPARLIPKNKGRAALGLKLIGSGNGGNNADTSTNKSSASNSILASIKSRNQKNPIDLGRETFGVHNQNNNNNNNNDDDNDDDDEHETQRRLASDGRSDGTGAPQMADLLRKYMLHQSASGNGDVQTDELLEFFNANFKPKETAVFKALLYKICTFKRLGDKGFWTIKSEFKDQ